MSGQVIVLDRDGVINEDSDDYIKSADEWVPLNGSLEAIKRLNKAGYRVAVASNSKGKQAHIYSNKLGGVRKASTDFRPPLLVCVTRPSLVRW